MNCCTRITAPTESPIRSAPAAGDASWGLPKAQADDAPQAAPAATLRACPCGDDCPCGPACDC